MSQITTPTSPDPTLENGEGVFYEIVNGQRVEKPLMGYFEIGIANLLLEYFATFSRANRLGRARIEKLEVEDNKRILDEMNQPVRFSGLWAW